ncbi:MAG: hypothetical protein QOD91_456 [Frankiales bacterium]|nr:hypothetical protein [Frankiales bacterium]
MRFMLLQDYGAPDWDCPPMDQWTPADVRAHIEFQVALNAELTGTGELIDAQALTAPEQARFVTADGATAPVVTDGPYPEGKELVAGYRTIDVDSLDRAVEIAARASAAPGPGGRAMRTRIEVREVMGRVGSSVDELVELSPLS